MRSILLALATGAALSLGGVAAHAMPAAPVSGFDAAPALVRVADHCGPGFHRDFHGFCRPTGRVFAARPCFVRHTPFGPRRVCP